MDPTDLLQRLALDPADLKPGPQRQANQEDAAARLGPTPGPVPCVACGDPARSTRIIATADRGRRAVPLADTLAVLRAAAEEAGVTVRVLVDPPQGA
ncbi:hypothetical protein ABZT45_43775 [Streptomyces sp. NPDC005356]|uniref:hypothetical protein n=1 Tax=Streptomyces sp. NPDC005356 TaxID=3157167 RepID=UPI0033B17F7A